MISGVASAAGSDRLELAARLPAPEVLPFPSSGIPSHAENVGSIDLPQVDATGGRYKLLLEPGKWTVVTTSNPARRPTLVSSREPAGDEEMIRSALLACAFALLAAQDACARPQVPQAPPGSAQAAPPPGRLRAPARDGRGRMARSSAATPAISGVSHGPRAVVHDDPVAVHRRQRAPELARPSTRARRTSALERPALRRAAKDGTKIWEQPCRRRAGRGRTPSAASPTARRSSATAASRSEARTGYLLRLRSPPATSSGGGTLGGAVPDAPDLGSPKTDGTRRVHRIARGDALGARPGDGRRPVEGRSRRRDRRRPSGSSAATSFVPAKDKRLLRRSTPPPESGAGRRRIGGLRR